MASLDVPAMSTSLLTLVPLVTLFPLPLTIPLSIKVSLDIVFLRPAMGCLSPMAPLHMSKKTTHKSPAKAFHCPCSPYVQEGWTTQLPPSAGTAATHPGGYGFIMNSVHSHPWEVSVILRAAIALSIRLFPGTFFL